MRRRSKFPFLIVLALVALVVWRSTRQTGTPRLSQGPTASHAAQTNLPRPPAVLPGSQTAQIHAPSTHGHIYAGIPRSTEPLEVLTNKGYVVGYSEEHRDPVWVAFRLFRCPNVRNPRPPGFEVDSRTSARVSQQDYSHSGYDRGHMAPNDAIGDCYGPEAQRQTFLMTNIVPQLPHLNREVWEHLEQRVAHDWADRFEEVWVITGSIFSAHPNKLSGGEDIPDACYKIVLDEEGGRPRMLAFIIPQEVEGKEHLEKFLTSVDEVEKETGLDFFPEMEKTLQDKLEAEIVKGLW